EARMQNAYCSFCRKSYREVGPLVEGPGDVCICGECVELSASIIDQETRRRSSGDWTDYLRKKMDRLVDSVEGWIVATDPRMAAFIDPGRRDVDPGRFQSLLDLCQATALLLVVAGMLDKLKAKTLNDTERKLLQDVEVKVTQLRTVLDARASGQGSA